MKKTLEQIRDEIEDMLMETQNDDLRLLILQNIAEHFCGTWDLCEGYKHAIMETVDDQVNNHGNEQAIEDFEELLEKITKEEKYE